MVMEAKPYKSPKGKLLRFFEKSRNGWKRKCKETKVRLKRLTNRVQSLETSRAQWKERARQRGKEVRQLRQELEKQKQVAC